MKRVEAFDREVFVKLSGDKYEPMRCVVPIVIDAGSTSTNTNTNTSNSTSNNTTTNNTPTNPTP